MQYIVSFLLFLFCLLLNTSEETTTPSETQITTEELVHEQVTEEIREEIEEQREFTIETLISIESSLIGRIDELRTYIDGRFAEHATGIEGTSTDESGNGNETEETIQETDIKPDERHFWFRRIKQ